METSPGDAVVSLTGIVKTFAANPVLRDVDFELRAGEVHALAGANGSGKSTLMKIIYGAHSPTAGTLRLRGAPVTLSSPGHALRLGIAAVPQELPLMVDLTVAENIAFGDPPRRAGVISWAETRRRACRALARIDGQGRISPDQTVGSLDLAGRQLVSIARALARGADIVVLDEPTSSLDADAVARLWETIAVLKAEGRAIAFISQRLDDIFAVADRVSVLRDGVVVETSAVAHTTPARVAEAMAGHALAEAGDRRPPRPERCLVALEEVSAGRLDGVALRVGEGELVGVAGLPGSGADDLLGALAGRIPCRRGRIEVNGSDVSRWSVRRRVRAGIAYVSGDRRAEGLVGSQTVAFNLCVCLHARAGLRPFSLRRHRRAVAGVVDEIGLQPPDPDAPAASLSGGNQQKVVVGRWLLAGARVWVLNDPTRGVDVHARADIHRLIRDQMAAAGGAAVMTSSDVREMLEFCDRLLVVHRGRVVAELDPATATEHQVLALAGGAPADDPLARAPAAAAPSPAEMEI